ncbi:MAG: hypothetical protein HY690_07445 [Chloroflexi bacterium]|nr:hypothetical protein [Chloroflexota bacterium]
MNGKLYLLGAGWNTLHCATFPYVHPHLALTLMIRVDWTEADEPVKFAIRLEDEDNRPVAGGPTIEGQLTVGRPSTAVVGDPFDIPLAVELNNLQLERPGRYAFALQLNDQDQARVWFRARPSRG